MPSKIPGISAAVRARLHAARIVRLATLDAERSPPGVPVCFVYHGSVFYSAIDRKPKSLAAEKLAPLEHVRSTPQVAPSSTRRERRETKRENKEQEPDQK
jgi:hypothetical protein